MYSGCLRGLVPADLDRICHLNGWEEVPSQPIQLCSSVFGKTSHEILLIVPHASPLAG